jgi:hypothetical protein
MARALECPACGHRHRIDAIPDASTFRCEQCGQALKVPTPVSSHPDAPAPPARGTAPPERTAAATTRADEPAGPAGAPAPVGPPPRRSANPSSNGDPDRDRSVRTAAGVSATVAATAPVDNGAGAGSRGRRGAPVASEPAPARAKRARVHWYWRLLAWIVAVPLGFLITAWPAYKLGFIAKDDLLDLFVGTGIGRYVRLAVVTVVWALVTALLVQLFVEGGRMRADRRRRTRAAA